MEQCFRIAFWMMFLLTGYLQAQPVRERRSAGDGSCIKEIDRHDLALGRLTTSEVSCSGTMNFTSPVIGSVTKKCRVAALRLFIEGMHNAQNNCTHKQWLINSTIETLENVCENMNTTECNSVKEVHEVQFEQFVSETGKFAEWWKSIQEQ